MRGLGEGQRPMNDTQNQTMTNATVSGAAIVNGSNIITVKFQGGDSELILDPGVPVTAILPADPSVCSRRLNIDPPCRFNIDPGRVVAV